METFMVLLMEFWSQLAEDRPDLKKLQDSSSKILPAKIIVEELWKKLDKDNSKKD